MDAVLKAKSMGYEQKWRPEEKVPKVSHDRTIGGLDQGGDMERRGIQDVLR